MKLSYRTGVILKRVGITVLVLLVTALLGLLCWVIWLGRFVVYTRDQGAMLDFDQPPFLEGAYREPPSTETVPIYYNEGDNAINTSTELTQLKGYYVELKQLRKDPQKVREELRMLEPGTAVILPLKSIYGGFFYDSSVSPTRSDMVKQDAIQEIIAYLNGSELYSIASVPALRDQEYGLNHVNDGLPDKAYNGGALWSDEQGCYWLNPTSQGTVGYLLKIANELKSMGFDEVLFEDYQFPKDDRIMFDGDRGAALAATAQTLITACSTEHFAVSFVGDGSWQLPKGRSRMYMKDVDPANVAGRAEGMTMEDKPVHLVFLTDLHDTRFEDYGVMRPLSAAH